jgi:hypothetical protein
LIAGLLGTLKSFGNLPMPPRAALSEARVDPNFLSEQPGAAPDSSIGEEGVSYLRRLKKEVGDAPAWAAVQGHAKAEAAGTTIDWEERRRSARLRCSGSAEFRTEGSGVRLWGTLTDISLHGCYLEMNTTFPVDTKVDLVLKSCGIRIQAPGTVRASYAFLGMGIRFQGIAPEQQSQLEQLLGALAGHRTFTNGIPASENGLHDTLRAVDPRALLAEVVEFFRKNSQLSRDQFQEISKRTRRL